MVKQRRTWIYLCCFSCLPIFAQQDGAAKRAQAAPSPLITLDVVASDKSGKPISGLTEQDFTLLDNKQSRKIVSFHAVEGPSADVPVEVILLVDEVNDSFSNVAYERDRLAKFLQRDSGSFPFPCRWFSFQIQERRFQQSLRSMEKLLSQNSMTTKILSAPFAGRKEFMAPVTGSICLSVRSGNSPSMR